MNITLSFLDKENDLLKLPETSSRFAHAPQFFNEYKLLNIFREEYYLGSHCQSILGFSAWQK